VFVSVWNREGERERKKRERLTSCLFDDTVSEIVLKSKEKEGENKPSVVQSINEGELNQDRKRERKKERKREREKEREKERKSSREREREREFKRERERVQERERERVQERENHSPLSQRLMTAQAIASRESVSDQQPRTLEVPKAERKDCRWS